MINLKEVKKSVHYFLGSSKHPDNILAHSETWMYACVCANKSTNEDKRACTHWENRPGHKHVCTKAETTNLLLQKHSSYSKGESKLDTTHHCTHILVAAAHVNTICVAAEISGRPLKPDSVISPISETQ